MALAGQQEMALAGQQEMATAEQQEKALAGQQEKHLECSRKGAVSQGIPESPVPGLNVISRPRKRRRTSRPS